MSNRVRLRAGLNAKIAHTTDVTAHLGDVAGEILTAARAIAAGHTDTGAYAASLQVTRGTVDAYVTADIDYAAALEFGHHSPLTGLWVPGAHILARALDAAT